MAWNAWKEGRSLLLLVENQPDYGFSLFTFCTVYNTYSTSHTSLSQRHGKVYTWTWINWHCVWRFLFSGLLFKWCLFLFFILEREDIGLLLS
jgi:hypothetical protein